MGDGSVGSGSVDSGCHEHSENVWFVWSKTSNSGDVNDTDGRTDGRGKIELLSF